jgi:hypothetical protein
MGEVWRARDPRLGRDVALKVLPAAFVADAERLARFEREAKVLASLNHPHIGGIYGLEEAVAPDGGAVRALVLELVEGPTLADRIARGSIPIDEALPIARQIAEALEAAHEQGIIHRDLKPANVKVRPDGTVKVLDFGLAKALQPQLAAAESADLSHSPTLTLGGAATQMGVIVGTAAYMAPEQARGRSVDRRADIWAFGCVLFEMLSGRRAFAGADVSDTLAAVLRSAPEWEALPASTPRPIARLLRRCLEKTPEKRLRDIGDARLELEEALSVLTAGGEVSWPTARIAIRPPARAALVVLATAGSTLALGVLLGVLLGRGASRRTEAESAADALSRPTTHTAVNLPQSRPLALGTRYPFIGFERTALALSPNGRHLVYVGQEEDSTRLYHRDLTRPDDPRPIPGTEGALHAFFSPSSEELGFLTDDRVKKVALDGGASATLCRARAPGWGTWIEETIYFSHQLGAVLASVPATGGEPATLFDTVERFGRLGAVSSVLPDGRAVLVCLRPRGNSASNHAEIRVIGLDGRGEVTLPITGYAPRHVASGHLIFASAGSVLAAPFDLDSLKLLGDAVPVLDGVALESTSGILHAAFADNGTIAFVPGGDLATGRLAWVDRKGNGDFFEVADRIHGTFDLAADDRRFALQVADVRDYVSIWDAQIGGAGRDLPIPGTAGWPVWSPDGAALAVRSWTPERSELEPIIYEIASGATKDLPPVIVDSWVKPTRMGVFGSRPSRVGTLEVGSGEEPRWIREATSLGALGMIYASLSPDAAAIAYNSLEGTGRYQVWLERVDGGGRKQVSTDGGIEPVWCRDCGELFYRHRNRILASRVELASEVVAGDPREVFVAPDFVDTDGISFRVSSDGQKLYYVRRSKPPVRDRIHIVHNWFDELEAKAPRSP